MDEPRGGTAFLEANGERLKAIRTLMVYLAVFVLVATIFIPGVAQAYVPPEGMFGWVKDGVTGEPIAGATVEDLTEGGQATTNSNGYWQMFITIGGSHDVRAYRMAAPTYNAQTISIYISRSTGFGIGNHGLLLINPGFWGYVKTPGGSPISDRLIEISGFPFIWDYSDSTGQYHLIPSGTFPSQNYVLKANGGTGYLSVINAICAYTWGQYYRKDFILDPEKDFDQVIFAAYMTKSNSLIRIKVAVESSHSSSDTIGACYSFQSGVFKYTASGQTQTQTTTGWFKTSDTAAGHTSLISKRLAHLDGNVDARYGYMTEATTSWNTVWGQSYLQQVSDPHASSLGSQTPDAYIQCGYTGDSGTGGQLYYYSKTTSWTQSANVELTAVIPFSSWTTKVGGGISYSETHSDQTKITITFYNLDPNSGDSNPHGINIWFEGNPGQGVGGAILHVWERC